MNTDRDSTMTRFLLFVVGYVTIMGVMAVSIIALIQGFGYNIVVIAGMEHHQGWLLCFGFVSCAFSTFLVCEWTNTVRRWHEYEYTRIL